MYHHNCTIIQRYVLCFICMISFNAKIEEHVLSFVQLLLYNMKKIQQ